MKKIVFALLLVLGTLASNAQSYNDTITWQDTSRAFIIHIPTAYQSTDTVPIVFALHGLGDYASNFVNIGMNPIADTANFIVVYPQALIDQGLSLIMGNPNATAFNAGINTLSTVDDVGLIGALIDSIGTQYNIDTSRVYVTGFSMGAFATHRIACELSDKITAIASVSGQLALTIEPACNTSKEVPVFHIHGTADQTVKYNGDGMLQMTSVDATLARWRTNNGCDNNPVLTQYPDNEPDGFVTTVYNWTNCNNDSEILLYRVDSAEHQWLYSPVNDFDSATEIWKFFSKHPKQESNSNSIHEESNDGSLSVYPNPTSNILTIEGAQGETIQIFDSMGRNILTKRATTNRFQVDLSSFSSGIYCLRSGKKSVLITKE